MSGMDEEAMVRQEEIKGNLKLLLGTYTVEEVQNALTELSEEGYE